jgi:hypothetical protein
VSLQRIATGVTEDVITEGTVKDNDDGTYTVEYVPYGPGDYSLVTSLFGQTLNGFPKELHFKQSKLVLRHPSLPFPSHISAGANGAKSEVSGTGIKAGVADRPVRVLIKAKDIDGEPRVDGGDNFRVVFEHDGGESLDAAVIDNGTVFLQNMVP